jgi:hypothetical protein
MLEQVKKAYRAIISKQVSTSSLWNVSCISSLFGLGGVIGVMGEWGLPAVWLAVLKRARAEAAAAWCFLFGERTKRMKNVQTDAWIEAQEKHTVQGESFAVISALKCIMQEIARNFRVLIILNCTMPCLEQNNVQGV